MDGTPVKIVNLSDTLEKKELVAIPGISSKDVDLIHEAPAEKNDLLPEVHEENKEK